MEKKNFCMYIWTVRQLFLVMDYCQSVSLECHCKCYFSSVQFSRSVMSNSLWPHESQQARPPCPSPTPRVHPNSSVSSRWCHPAISFSVVPFSSCPDIKEWDYFTFKILCLNAFTQLTFPPSLYTIHPNKYTVTHWLANSLTVPFFYSI